jgi:hypothetical protein
MSTEAMNDEHNHFPVSAVVACLSEIAKEHDREKLIQAARYIDMTPTLLLRGVSFLSECLEANDDAPPMQAKLARAAIQEITALCAVLLEIDCDASNYRMLRDQQGAQA